ncbi:immunity protein sdpi [Anaeramoeba ignava]|uniref:Immunity protein sdpi n=1 Tax=Anaeramoeba ignava TaxID=1746090 RepID=A0A9Q0L8D5_ANAIG|nr:immunity protein sdpi [Anaeramoeba ignava]
MKFPTSYISFFFVFISIIQSLYFYPKLPLKVAIHYNKYLNPDKFGDKSWFVLIYNLVQIGIFLIFEFVHFHSAKKPESMKIPNADYWIVEERCAKTVRKNQIMNKILCWGTLSFLICIFQLVFLDNLSEHTLDYFGFVWIIIFGYLGYLVIWSSFLLYIFRIPKLKFK